ncbi:Serine/threonine-protein phosphatase 2A activator [Coemansia spiralis]|uniref:Serine/threonine-protein phosphatase 2A activator n=2 Tax=Coemansia TaxID=4863 RepID=A0A9W8G306_9FUNG|nr:Serine/threonine-protein phosphatase 2A activator [Coemansia umbellata]KAJ2620236.1 Serine/threonine-protein phosphatase 2A activator [Coemansia sp. RSA 1358]KAJ2672564.1 Serine/threonine-protein phosphatase 2A activator [Coemansia spiralis]
MEDIGDSTDETSRGPYVTPQRRILDPKDMSRWQRSSACREITSFVEQLSRSVEGKPVSGDYSVSPHVQGICRLLQNAELWIGKYQPDTSESSRFGNRAFRKWIAELEQQTPQLLHDLLPSKHHNAVIELAPYLTQAFGNGTRIDYGSGHELSFAMWLLCLCKVGFLEPSDSAAIVLSVFRQYISLCQKLQRTYNLEPAGSHGVWGLDDYQFLSFYFGSAQLIGSNTAPAVSLDMHFVSEHASDYIYLQGIKFITEMKRGPFFEHSRQLYDISGVPRWEKVNQGLGKMYKVEVLGKFPVVQHLVFGKLLAL